MIFFLAIVLLAILAFSAQADGKPIQKEDVVATIVVILMAVGILVLGKVIQML